MTGNQALLKRIAKRFRQEKTIVDAIFNGVPGIIYLIDDQGRAVRWNRRLPESTGYTDEEIRQMNCLEYFRGADAELIAQRVVQTLTDGSSDAEVEFYRKDGSHFSIYLTSVRVIIDGKAHIAGVGIDISERRRAVEALARSEAELRRHKKELELTVEQRTAEVVAANQELTAMNQEMSAMNEELQHANSQLGAEIELRQQ